MKLYKIKKQLRVIKQSLKKTLHKKIDKRGFSLISVMVSSVIGLIVVFGLNKSLVHLNMQSQELQSQMKQLNLQTTVQNFFSNPASCSRFFSCSYNFKRTPNNFRFSVLPNSAIDFSNTNFVKSYKLKVGGYNLFIAECPCVPGLSTCDYHGCTIKMYLQTGNDIKYQQISQFRVRVPVAGLLHPSCPYPINSNPETYTCEY